MSATTGRSVISYIVKSKSSLHNKYKFYLIEMATYSTVNLHIYIYLRSIYTYIYIIEC